MGSLETGLSFKRDHFLLRSSSTSRSERHSFLQRPRSRFSRFLLFKKLDYLQWICTVAVFFFFVVIFQMFLPGSVMEKSGLALTKEIVSGDLTFPKEIAGLDFKEDIRFEPKILARFEKGAREANLSSAFNRRRQRYGYRKPHLALVFADLLLDPQQILMVTVAAALQEIGYAIQVYSLEDGPVRAVWGNLRIPVTLIQTNASMGINVDWLNYDGILVNSLEARDIFTCFMQEPFKSLPLIWSIHEGALATRLRHYNSSGQTGLLNNWKKVFSRATVVVFPNYVLPMIYSPCDAGNYFVIPGSPIEAWEADNANAIYKDNLREGLGYGLDDFVIAIVGSQFFYRDLWLEHALILKAIYPLFTMFPLDNNPNSHLEIIILSGDSTSNYDVAVEAISLNLKYPRGVVKHIAIGGDAEDTLSAADLVIYGSFLEEQSFPDILIKAMCFGKPIIAPDLFMIRKYVDDRVNGYLFPKENTMILTQILLDVVSMGKSSPLARNISSNEKGTARNLMVLETVEGYASLVENVLRLPSEVASPKSVPDIPPKLKENWQWDLFEAIVDSTYLNRTLRSFRFLDKIEQKWNHTQIEDFGAITSVNEPFLYSIWEEEKYIQMENTRKRREEEELRDRTDQPRGTWEEVYRNARKVDRLKNNLHERDDGELERTGQLLSIYEPYFGEGAWPFLHHTSLYRGIGLSTKGRRPGADDVDAPSRLPLLGNSYYRDALGEHGAFFAIANRIDRVHKNAWIGFQSWRATARKASLSKSAENALLDAIQTRMHGDTLYFWVRMDVDPRNPLQQDFWSFCDSINAGNCKFAFSESLKKMYGIKHDMDYLPPMPLDGDTWSVMHSWALPTRSFLEFVMFSRMFVDALDAQIYEEHNKSGHCYLSLSKDKHCYSRMLELLINVWAYHSAKRMVYINPETGVMQEHHKLKNRRGHMWVKWFKYPTLKSMDEDLAEEFDSDHPTRRWLWPLTGEVFWQGAYERERSLLRKEKEEKRKKKKEKISRIQGRTHQRPIGKYVKHSVGKIGNSNSTMKV